MGYEENEFRKFTPKYPQIGILIYIYIYYYMIIYVYMVGGFNPSEKNESQLGWLFPIYRITKNVPNHQPVHMYIYRERESL